MENEQEKKQTFDIALEVKVACLMESCFNNVNSACNLKGLAIDNTGKCQGLVKVKVKKK